MIWSRPWIAYVIAALLAVAFYRNFDLSVAQTITVVVAFMFARRNP